MTTTSSPSHGHTDNLPEVAFLGFGEAATAFARGFARSVPVACLAYEIKTEADGP